MPYTPVPNPDVQRLTPCGRFPAWRDRAARLRRATANALPTCAAVARASAFSSKYPATSSQSERGGIVILVDRGREDARLDVGRYRVEVIGRREAPAIRAFVEKTVIAQVVVVLEIRILKTIAAKVPPCRLSARRRAGAARPQFPCSFGFRCLFDPSILMADRNGIAVRRPGRSAQQKHRLFAKVSTRAAGTAMPAFSASDSATASHTTALNSSSGAETSPSPDDHLSP